MNHVGGRRRPTISDACQCGCCVSDGMTVNFRSELFDTNRQLAMPNMWRMVGRCFCGCPRSSESKTADSHSTFVEVIRVFLWSFSPSWIIPHRVSCSPFTNNSIFHLITWLLLPFKRKRGWAVDRRRRYVLIIDWFFPSPDLNFPLHPSTTQSEVFQVSHVKKLFSLYFLNDKSQVETSRRV